MKRKAEIGKRSMEELGEANGLIVEHGDIRGDEKNIAILFFLYLMQGIPLGLCSSIPMILQNHGVSYKQQVNNSKQYSTSNWLKDSNHTILSEHFIFAGWI